MEQPRGLTAHSDKCGEKPTDSGWMTSNSETIQTGFGEI